MRNPRPGPGAAALILGMAMAGCVAGNGTRDDADGLADGLALWESQRPDGYAYTLSRHCFCARTSLGPFLVEAAGDSVVRVRRIEDKDTLAVDGDLQAYSIRALFRTVEERLAGDNHREEVEYHPSYGFPISASFDHSDRVADDEFAFSVIDFRKE